MKATAIYVMFSLKTPFTNSLYLTLCIHEFAQKVEDVLCNSILPHFK